MLSDQPINYPKVRQSDAFVAMSQKALEMYLKGAKKNSVVIIDPDLVSSDGLDDYDVVLVRAMKMADDLGLRLVSNMVMLGALTKKAELFSLEVLEKAVKDIVPAKHLEINVKAIRAGASLV